MLNEGLKCNEAMQMGFRLAASEANGFRELEDLLQQENYVASKHVTEAFIKGCKDVAMGLVHWR